MQITDFLTQYVEGYLFEDLDSMAAIGLPPGKSCGAVGYPMVATTLAGIELLGGLTHPTIDFHPREGRKFFTFFWEKCYSGGDHRMQLGEPIYDLVRNGLAHVFVAKPTITVYKGRDDRMHLLRDRRGDLWINAGLLSGELKVAYHQYVKPHVAGELGRRMQAQLNEMLRRDAELVAKHRTKLDAAPAFDLRVPVATTTTSSLASPFSSTETTTIDIDVSSPAPPVRRS